MIDDNTITIAERYGKATASSNLRLDENRRGAVNLLIAAGVAARGDQKGSRALGGALQRLLSEWEQAAKPQRMPVISMKSWIEALPLVKVGERMGNPIMGRDKEGARAMRKQQQATSDSLYEQELLQIAQRLQSRFLVRDALYAMAVQWGCQDPDEVVARAIVYWLASKCHNCHGTGSVQAGDKVRTCGHCEGSTEAPVPGESAGRRMVNYMDLCRVTWLGAFKQAYRGIHDNT
jgi:hypothetical protein